MPTSHSLKILFVVNSIAGGASKEYWENGIWQYFRDTPHQIEVYHTDGRHDRQSLTHWIDEWQPDRLVSVGGDGTLKLCSEVLYRKNIPLCAFPAGSANGMAKELGMPNTVEACIDVLLNGVIKATDMIRINEHFCIHLSDIGLNAQLVKYFERNNVRGKLGYAKELLRVLWHKRQMDVHIIKSGETISRKAFMVVLANASMYGTGARINPVSNLHDGIFEVIILKKLSVLELLKMLFLNRAYHPRKTELLQAESLTIRVKKRAYFQVDGEYLGKTRRLSAKIAYHALQLIFPVRAGS